MNKQFLYYCDPNGKATTLPQAILDVMSAGDEMTAREITNMLKSRGYYVETVYGGKSTDPFDVEVSSRLSAMATYGNQIIRVGQVPCPYTQGIRWVNAYTIRQQRINTL